MSTSTSTAVPCLHAETSGFEPPGTPQIKQVYVAMNPLLVYTLAPMHLPAFHIPRASGKTTWEPTSTSTPTATPCFHVEISGSDKHRPRIDNEENLSTHPSTSSGIISLNLTGVDKTEKRYPGQHVTKVPLEGTPISLK
ncbi:hypothetical protein THAOC_22094 [Thalassiosira oceanica]|uniref:Uncharacterized protein n=1 Tax=Thalassiosira oceanica TaxID=159749 RepID=K0SH14_THAOC|nr:hypothetical protein THAOC_22094 [Thalassiosira oceanica]|eukprot:EJK57827.1 hypothetical protein THAOC_22094 [Thalassiosira oceanica]